VGYVETERVADMRLVYARPAGRGQGPKLTPFLESPAGLLLGGPVLRHDDRASIGFSLLSDYISTL
jgi:hypothetical protein